MYGYWINEKYKDIISFAFWGICTTAVNITVYWGCAHSFGFGVMTSTILAWVTAVSFAYLTNRKWVFHSRAEHVISVLWEMTRFFSCRFLTGLLDMACMFVFVHVAR